MPGSVVPGPTPSPLVFFMGANRHMNKMTVYAFLLLGMLVLLAPIFIRCYQQVFPAY